MIVYLCMCMGDEVAEKLSVICIGSLFILGTSVVGAFSSIGALISVGSTIVPSDCDPWSEPDDPFDGTKVVLLRLPGEEGALIAENLKWMSING